jgi:hypothetical protein
MKIMKRLLVSFMLLLFIVEAAHAQISPRDSLTQGQRLPTQLVCFFQTLDGSGWCPTAPNAAGMVFKVGDVCNCGNFHICGGRTQACNGYFRGGYRGIIRYSNSRSGFNCAVPGCRFRQN